MLLYRLTEHSLLDPQLRNRDHAAASPLPPREALWPRRQRSREQRDEGQDRGAHEGQRRHERCDGDSRGEEEEEDQEDQEEGRQGRGGGADLDLIGMKHNTTSEINRTKEVPLRRELCGCPLPDFQNNG